MATRRKIPKWDRNASPVGMYVATYIQRFEFEDEDTRNPNRRCRAWENMMLVRGSSPKNAYSRALQRVGEDLAVWRDANGAKGKLMFEGFTSFLRFTMSWRMAVRSSGGTIKTNQCEPSRPRSGKNANWKCSRNGICPSSHVS